MGKQFKIGTIAIIALASGFFFICVIGFVINRAITVWLPRSRSRHFAMSNMREIAAANLIYAYDSDQIFPLGTTWMEGLTPFTPLDSDPFHSPALQLGKSNPLIYGVAYLNSMAGTKLTLITSPSNQPIAFESNLLQFNAVGTLDSLPNPGRYRFRSGSYNPEAMADGSVRRVFVPSQRRSN